MPKIGLNLQTQGAFATDANGNMRRVHGECAFVAVVVDGTGVEAIYEGVRLANVQRVDAITRKVADGGDEPSDDVDSR